MISSTLGLARHREEAGVSDRCRALVRITAPNRAWLLKRCVAPCLAFCRDRSFDFLVSLDGQTGPIAWPSLFRAALRDPGHSHPRHVLKARLFGKQSPGRTRPVPGAPGAPSP